MLEDALKFSSISEKMTEEAYILCIEHYIEQGNLDKSLKLLDSLKPAIVIKCCERICFRAHSFLSSKIHFAVSEYYFEILNSLELRLKKAQDIVDKRSIANELPIQEVKNTYILHKKFDKRMSLKEFCHTESCEKMMDDCVKELMSTGDVCDVSSKVGNLSQMLQLPQQEGILDMMKHALNGQNETLVPRIMR
jgi:hypothetical protein